MDKLSIARFAQGIHYSPRINNIVHDIQAYASDLYLNLFLRTPLLLPPSFPSRRLTCLRHDLLQILLFLLILRRLYLLNLFLLTQVCSSCWEERTLLLEVHSLSCFCK